MSALYRALRGVCIGPERHLVPGGPPAPLDKGTAQFLLSIGAVEEVPAPAPDEVPAEPVAAQPPSPAAPAPALVPAPAPAAPAPAPAKPGKKEK
jgi:hypothetical protein